VFIEGSRGKLFCTLRLPNGEPSHAVMVVPAFGDEMNKTRRMITETAKRLNESQVAVLIPDLFGTGDSEGNFADADWNGWIEDLGAVRAWAAHRNLNLNGLIGIRTGALMSAEFVRTHEDAGIRKTIFWQPVLSGRQFVRQFLRVRTMANAVNSGARESIDDLIATIESGEKVLAGGYELGKAIVEPLLSADMTRLACKGLGSLHAIEVTRVEEKCGDYSEQLGEISLTGVRCLGEPYWASTETVCDMNVVSGTVELLR
jgi:exosortase A-associated hydrolase 2